MATEIQRLKDQVGEYQMAVHQMGREMKILRDIRDILAGVVDDEPKAKELVRLCRTDEILKKLRSASTCISVTLPK